MAITGGRLEADGGSASSCSHEAPSMPLIEGLARLPAAIRLDRRTDRPRIARTILDVG